MKDELDKRQSEVIAAMRFPLMVLLLFAHVLPMTSVPIEMNLSEMNTISFRREYLIICPEYVIPYSFSSPAFFSSVNWKGGVAAFIISN